MSASLLVFIWRDDTAFARKVASLSPRINTVTRQQLNEDPALLAKLDVVYGHMQKGELEGVTGLRWLQTTSAGVNGIIPQLKERDIVITTTSGIHAEPIAEQMFGMVLGVTRRLYESWESQRECKWGIESKPQRDLTLLAGKTLGILGVGAIGTHSAIIGKAFGMKVIGLRRSKGEHPHIETIFGDDERAEFLSQCDVVMNSLPLTDDTRGFMGDAEFTYLKPGAIFVNAGRGATVSTDALIRALESGQVGAACLDVTDPEPLPTDHPLWTTPNVYITPHTGGGRPDYNDRADEIFLANLRFYLDNQPMKNVVDIKAGY